MSIVDEVKVEAQKRGAQMVMDAKFLELQAFYETMLASGIAIKRPYDIPPLDTIGRSLYEALALRHAE